MDVGNAQATCQAPSGIPVVKDEYPTVLPKPVSTDTNKEESSLNATSPERHDFDRKEWNRSRIDEVQEVLTLGTSQGTPLFDTLNEEKQNTDCIDTNIKSDLTQTNIMTNKHTHNKVDAHENSIPLNVFTSGKENVMKEAQFEFGGFPTTEPISVSMSGALKRMDYQRHTDHVFKDDRDISNRESSTKAGINVNITIGKQGIRKKLQGKRNCVLCNLSFDSESGYKKHYLNMHRIKSCSYCSKTFKNMLSHKKHYESVHKKINCEKCNEVLNGNIEMRKHLNLHKNNGGSSECVCSVCGQKCKGKWKLKEHLYKSHDHIDEGLHHCADCKLIFQSKTKFERHLECLRHQDSEASIKQKIFICNLCGYKTAQKRAFSFHLLRKHNQMEDGVLSCDICKMTFTLKHAYKKHMECHRNSSFKCNQCPEILKDFKSLRKHQIATHRKRYCPECPQIFKTDHEVKVS